MIGSMRHEAFHASGFHSTPELGVYGGWVALEGSPATHQPFLNERKDVTLLLSGECFADRAVIADLEHRGHNIGSKPGHWLVQAYEEQGDPFIENLNGLFSGLLIDKRKKHAFLFNDRYGFDRIYVHEAGDELYFASEAKALLRVLPHLREFDPDGVSQFLAVGSTLGGQTLFRGIHLLPGASKWSFAEGQCMKEHYFASSSWESHPVLSPEIFQCRFQETLARIVPRYFASDQKLGIALTAGLDSRMLLACRPALAQPPVCYTFGGRKSETLDARLAGRVAQACGMEHQVLRVNDDFFSDFRAHVDRTVYVTDGCFGVSGAHEIYLNRQARALAPIRLTGVFGGEVLREVSTFKPQNLDSQLLVPELSRAVAACAQRFTTAPTHPVTFAAFQEIPWNIFGSLAACRSQVTFRTPYLDNELVALAYQAPASIRNSSLSAVHLINRADAALGRIPTDMGLLGDTSRPSGTARRLFSKATFKLDYLCNDGLPHWLSPLDPVFDRLNSNRGIVGQHKYLRYRRWFRRELSGYLREQFSQTGLIHSSWWNPDFVRQLASHHIHGRNNYLQEINAVLTLDAVQRLLLRSPV